MKPSASPFVLLPGGPGFPASYYEELVVRLTEIGEVLVPPTTERFPRTVSEAARNLGIFIDSLPETPILLGHSFGAAVLIEALAEGIPAKAVILISGYSSGTMIRDAVMSRKVDLPKEFHDRYRDSRTPEEIGALLFEYWIPAYFCRVSMPVSIAAGVAAMDQAVVQHYLGNDFFNPSGEMLNWDRSACLKEIAVPVLFLAGASDYLNQNQIERMCTDIPNCRVWIGQHSSHNCWVEEPEAVFGAIRDFVAEIDSTEE